MTATISVPELRRLRLHLTGLWPHPQLAVPDRASSPTALEIINHHGMMQAQDWPDAALAVTARGASYQDLMTTIDRGDIIRTWPMRGTVHMLTPHASDWVSALLWPRTESSSASRLKELGINEVLIQKAQTVAEQNLHQPTTPKRLRELWAQVGISREQYYHILVMLVGRGVIVRGPRSGGRGEEQALILRSHWGGRGHRRQYPTGEDPQTAAQLVSAHLRGRAPATVVDIAYWAGTSQRVVKLGLAELKDQLETISWKQIERDGSKKLVEGYIFQNHWDVIAASSAPPWPGGVIALPQFDETMMLSQNRDWILSGGANIAAIWSRYGVGTKPLLAKKGFIGSWDKSGVNLLSGNERYRQAAERALIKK